MDTTDPVIESCPTNIIRTLELGLSGIIIMWMEPTATDISGIVTLVSRSHAPGTLFQVGDTIVTYTFRDPSGNEARCIFLVTVVTGKYLNYSVQSTPLQINRCLPVMVVSEGAVKSRSFAQVLKVQKDWVYLC